MFDSPTFFDEKDNQLSLKECIRILDDFVFFCIKMNATPFISFTGGDPLLRMDFFQILKETVKKGINFNILGNPHLLDKTTIKLLKKYKITGYQMSLDGLEKTHDNIRQKGSFQLTMNAFKLLKDNDIRTICMYTLSKSNFNDLIPLIKYMLNSIDKCKISFTKIFIQRLFGRFKPEGFSWSII